jgi:hypothetical protein
MTDLTTRVEAIERHLGMEKPVRVERSQEYKDAMVAAQKAGIPVQYKSDERTKWSDSGRWCFDGWHAGDYRIKPSHEQPAKPAQRVAVEFWANVYKDGPEIEIGATFPTRESASALADSAVKRTSLFREVLPDE